MAYTPALTPVEALEMQALVQTMTLNAADERGITSPYFIRHVDGNTLNDALSNLECVSWRKALLHPQWRVDWVLHLEAHQAARLQELAQKLGGRLPTPRHARQPPTPSPALGAQRERFGDPFLSIAARMAALRELVPDARARSSAAWIVKSPHEANGALQIVDKEHSWGCTCGLFFHYGVPEVTQRREEVGLWIYDIMEELSTEVNLTMQPLGTRQPYRLGPTRTAVRIRPMRDDERERYPLPVAAAALAAAFLDVSAADVPRVIAIV